MKQPLVNSDYLKMSNAKFKSVDWFWIKKSNPQADGTSEPVPSQQGQSTAAAHLNPLQSGCNAQQVILVPLQKASTHSLKNNYQTIEHHFYVCSDCVPKVRGYTRGPRQPPPVHPPTMGLPQTATTHPAAEAQPYRFTPNSFQTEVRRFWKRFGTSSILFVFFIHPIFMRFGFFYALCINHETANPMSSKNTKTST